MKKKNIKLVLGILAVIILLGSTIILASANSGDEELIIPCGGDEELVIGCIGDQELYFEENVPQARGELFQI